MSEYPVPKIMIHMAGARPVMKVKKSVADNWKRLPYRYLMRNDNTRIYIHSDLMLFSEEGRREWYRVAREKKHPVIMEIQEAVRNCYRDK
jgi:hypothetical protein